MFDRLCLRSLLLPLVGGLALALAAPPTLSGAAARQGDDHEALEEAMHGLKRHIRTLSKSAARPEAVGEALESVVAMQKITLDAKALEAPHKDGVEDRAAFATAFRADMARLLKELTEIEIDLLEGRHEKAGQRVTGALIQIRNSSHEKYQPDEDEDH